jgi:WD40 repeat protein
LYKTTDLICQISVHICNTSGQHEVHEALNFRYIKKIKTFQSLWIKQFCFVCDKFSFFCWCRPQTHRFCLFSIAFSPDSRSILGGSSDCCLYFYDLDRRERTHRVSPSFRQDT